MQKSQLSKKDIKEINAGLEANGILFEISKKDKVELVKDETKMIIINEVPSFFYLKDKIVPTLKHLQTNNFLKKVTVDMGAIKFVTNGADIMRPGVVSADENILEGEIVSVVDETHGKPLAVCISLFSGKEMVEAESGKVLTNIHYIGDSIWES